MNNSKKKLNVENLYDMLQDRGCEIPENFIKSINEMLGRNSSYNDVRTEDGNELKINFIYPKNKKYKLESYFATKRNIVNILMGENEPTIIAKYKNPNTFHKSDFGFNATKHILVPKHEKVNVSGQLLDLFLESTKIQKLDQLPILLTTDPISKYYGFVEGTVCKITRPSYISYRYVMEPEFTG